MHHCLILKPPFVPTAANNVGVQHFAVTTYLVFYIGFHYYNWMPTFCTHAYHPSCLLPLVGCNGYSPKCLACSTPLEDDWLECWGLPSNWNLASSDKDQVVWVANLKSMDGWNGGLSGQRRKLASMVHSQKTKVQFPQIQRSLSSVA